MKTRTIALAVAALSLVASPVVAQAAFDRANAPVEGESELVGSTALIAGILAVTAIVGGILIASDDDEPASA